MTPADLRRYRQRLGLTQEGLAEKLGVGKLFILKRETGERPIPPWLRLVVRCLAEHNHLR